MIFLDNYFAMRNVTKANLEGPSIEAHHKFFIL